LGLVLLAGLQLAAAEPPYEELRELIRKHLPGVTDQELDQAAVAGLLERFKGRVVLGDSGATAGKSDGSRVVKTAVYDEQFGYLRLGRVEGSAASDVASAWEKLKATNRLKGMVLDLRFAGGQDYPAAVAVADLFVDKELKLLVWGDSEGRSTAKPEAIKGPLMILVNSQTSGSAEALAAALRDARAGLVLGTNTAGQAAVLRDYKLKSGQSVQIASGTVRTGSSAPLGSSGFKPDIVLSVGSDDERAYFKNEYRTPDGAATGETAAATTNRTSRRITEADLVRMKKEGLDLEEELDKRPGRTAGPTRLPVRDPVLARALDLLKGLAIVRSTK
jgi:hypothetical protein